MEGCNADIYWILIRYRFIPFHYLRKVKVSTILDWTENKSSG